MRLVGPAGRMGGGIIRDLMGTDFIGDSVVSLLNPRDIVDSGLSLVFHFRLSGWDGVSLYPSAMLSAVVGIRFHH